jgi:signal peptidase I
MRTGWLGMALLPLVTVAVGALLFAHFLLGYGGVTVLSGSMRPDYPPGTIMLTQLRPVAGLRVGQILVMNPPGSAVPIAHRIVAISDRPGTRSITTKGDANPVPDAWRAIPRADRMPVVVGRIPHLGAVSMRLRSPLGRALIVLVLGLAATARATRRLLRS